MSQLLLGATIILLILVGFISADIMGFAIWKSNKFPVEGKVGSLVSDSRVDRLTKNTDSPSHWLFPGHG
jgi:3-dehydrosphinganine reductase